MSDNQVINLNKQSKNKAIDQTRKALTLVLVSPSWSLIISKLKHGAPVCAY